MMPELSIFDTELSQRVFLLGTIMFLALYAGAFLFLRRAEKSTDRAVWHKRTAVGAMCLAAAVAMLASAFGLFSPSHGIASQRAGLSVDALQNSINTSTLPVQQTDNPF